MAKVRTLVRKPLAMIVLFALLGVSAHAGSILIFTSRDVFESRVGSPQVAFNFNDRAAITQGDAQVSVQGLTISGGTPTIGGGALNYAFAAASPLSLHMNFAQDVFAFGIDIAPFIGQAALNISIGDFTLAHQLEQGTNFIGFAASTRGRFNAFNITLDALSLNGAPAPASMNFVVDNVFGYAVPDQPSTLLLLATGAGLVGLLTRRWKTGSEPADDDRGAGDADPM